MARSTNSFRYLDSSPEVIQPVVMLYVKYPLSLWRSGGLLGISTFEPSEAVLGPHAFKGRLAKRVARGRVGLGAGSGRSREEKPCDQVQRPRHQFGVSTFHGHVKAMRSSEPPQSIEGVRKLKDA